MYKLLALDILPFNTQDVLLCNSNLSSQTGKLHALADAKAEDNLVSDPGVGRRVDHKGGDKTTANSHKYDGGKEDRVEPSDTVDNTTRDDCSKDERQDERESETESKDRAEPDISDLEQTRWNSSFLLLPNLDADKGGKKNAGQYKKCNNATLVPGVFLSAPLERKDQADNTREEDKVSPRVKLLDLLLDGN
ncbi:hypothetical protein HG530_008003 [Fusarium avenaceum]|nr:hypothetical protein HG530_008003 [Fusarium avenaceum]